MLPVTLPVSFGSCYFYSETLNEFGYQLFFRFVQVPRTEWVLSWPGQVVIAGCQTFWTAEVSESLEKGDLAKRLYPQLQTQV